MIMPIFFSTIIVGLATTLISLIVAIFIKDKAVDIIKTELSNALSGEFAKFKLSFLETLDKTYINAKEYMARHEVLQDRVTSNEKRLDNLEVLLRSITVKG